jgi:hypothetical protein
VPHLVHRAYPRLDDRRWARSAPGRVTMGLQKFTTGSGYDYLTRQIAAVKGHNGQAAHYTQRGEQPGPGYAADRAAPCVGVGPPSRARHSLPASWED